MRQLHIGVRRSRGFLLVVAVVMLVVISLAIAALGNMTSADIRSGTAHMQSEQAYFAASSGLEYAKQQFGSGTQCVNLNNSSIAAGAGTFSTTAAFYAPVRTTLSAAITAADTTIRVASVAGYAPRGQVLIENEYINYASVSTDIAACGGTTQPCLLNAQRGASGTTAAVHAINTPVAQAMCVITATGVAGGATRVVQEGVRLPGAMVVYAKLNGDRIPYFRIWDGTAWGAERTATSVGAAGNIEFLILKFARTRNEAILGVQDSTGAITVQTWNGASWSAVTGIGTAAAGYRGFDIEYEKNSDRALIAYHTNVAAQFSYRIFDGSTWSGATNVAAPAGFGTLRWIELAPNPLIASNDIAMIMTNNGGNGAAHIYGMRWTGSSWSNMGVATDWDTTARDTAFKMIDVAYEQTSGDILFVWADNSNSNQFYRSYSGGALGAVSTLNIPLQGGNPSWLKLAPDPTSDRIMYAAADSGSDFDTRVWTGSAWDAAHVELDGTVENTTDMVFDIVYETHPSNANIAWAVWGDGNTVSRRRWNGATSTWAAATTSGDDTSHVALLAHPYKDSGAVFAIIYESTASATDDITAMQLTAGGAVWPAPTQIWGGSTVATPVRFRIDIDAERALISVYRKELRP